jgi:hypothetical protein
LAVSRFVFTEQAAQHKRQLLLILYDSAGQGVKHFFAPPKNAKAPQIGGPARDMPRRCRKWGIVPHGPAAARLEIWQFLEH